MKKIFLFLTVILTFLIVTASVSHTRQTNSIPDDLKSVFKTSCMACHADGGSTVAMSKLNFSKWEGYDSAKQSKKAAAICKKVSSGLMPPRTFLKAHPEATLTDAQKERICKWSETISRD